MTLLGVAAAAGLTYVVAAMIPPEIPFSLDSRLILTYAVVLVGVGLLGTLLSLRRIAKIDPLIAIGRVD